MRLFAAMLLLGACRNGGAPPTAVVPARPPASMHAATPLQAEARERDRPRWRLSSAGATIVQEPEGDTSCSLRCDSSGGAWQVRLCAAERVDLRAISRDCEWLAVLRRDPEVDDSIPATVIGALFHRGVPARLVAAGELPAGAVSVALDRLQWLGEGPAQFRGGSLALPPRAGPDAPGPLAAAAGRKAAGAAAPLPHVGEQGPPSPLRNPDQKPPPH